MNKKIVSNILYSKYPKDIVDNLLDNYTAAIHEYRKENWKYFGNEIGQFIEDFERLIEYELTNKYTPFEKKLAIFDNTVLLRWENSNSTFDQSYRLLIPRVLFSMNCIRNKRGMIHKNHITPNRMDSTLLLNDAKWLLAELIRLNSSLSFDETANIINAIIEKEIDIVWKINGKSRIVTNIKNCKDQILVFLYKYQKLSIEKLLDYTEYSNKSRFYSIVKSLHKDRLIDLCNNECTISPSGIRYIEKILKNLNS